MMAEADWDIKSAGARLVSCWERYKTEKRALPPPRAPFSCLSNISHPGALHMVRDEFENRLCRQTRIPHTNLPREWLSSL